MRRWPVALALVLLLAGCGGGAEPTGFPAWQEPSAPTAPAPLTLKEARGRYLAIVAPYHTARDELAEAMRAGKPWPTVRRLAATVASADAARAEQLRATVWPAAVRAAVAALLDEDDVALRHWRLAAGARDAAELTRQVRAAAAHDGEAQANRVRAALGLPVYRKS